MTTTMPQWLEGRKVNSLMQMEQRQWDDEVLMDICNDRDKNLIKKILLSTRLEADTWFWFTDDNGRFSVKSCYSLLQGEIQTPFGSF